MNIVSSSDKDLFLYNPRKSVNTKVSRTEYLTFHRTTKRVSSQGKTIIVQNELAELVITLRNPFVFELELHNVSLV